MRETILARVHLGAQEWGGGGKGNTLPFTSILPDNNNICSVVDEVA